MNSETEERRADIMRAIANIGRMYQTAFQKEIEPLVRMLEVLPPKPIYLLPDETKLLGEILPQATL